MGVAGEIAVILLVLSAMVLTLLASLASSNSEGDALYAFRQSLSDPENVLQSWDPTLVNPCTWFHITCNQDNRVTRLYSCNPPFSFFFYLCSVTAGLMAECWRGYLRVESRKAMEN